MAYNFKRLSAVDSAIESQTSDSFLIVQNGQVKKINLSSTEEITEVPETAKTFVEVDGIIKRAPFSSGGGDVNLDNLIFDLECTCNNTILTFSNIPQIQKVLDNNMAITVIWSEVLCGSNNVYTLRFLSVTDSMAVETASAGVIYAKMKSSYNSAGGNKYLTISLSESDYALDKLTATEATITSFSSGYTLLRAYASAF